jgi:hypothetical protein
MYQSPASKKNGRGSSSCPEKNGPGPVPASKKNGPDPLDRIWTFLGTWIAWSEPCPTEPAPDGFRLLTKSLGRNGNFQKGALPALILDQLPLVLWTSFIHTQQILCSFNLNVTVAPLNHHIKFRAVASWLGVSCPCEQSVNYVQTRPL